jgi:hypothetical protein
MKNQTVMKNINLQERKDAYVTKKLLTKILGNKV